MDVYVENKVQDVGTPEYIGPYVVVAFDGRDVVRVTSRTNGDAQFNIDALVWKTEEGVYMPVRRKQLQRFRGECG